jgi:excisionase family DNA binding protein
MLKREENPWNTLLSDGRKWSDITFEELDAILERGKLQKAMTDDDDIELLWGCGPIADYTKLKRRQVYHLLETGRLPAKKVGSKWVTTRKALREFFKEVA